MEQLWVGSWIGSPKAWLEGPSYDYKTQTMIRKTKSWLETWKFQLLPYSPEKEERLEMELIIDCAP